MTTYARVLEVLADGEWHTDEELRAVTEYPAEWLKELRYAGFVVAERRGAGLVRVVGRRRPRTAGRRASFVTGRPGRSTRTGVRP